MSLSKIRQFTVPVALRSSYTDDVLTSYIPLPHSCPESWVVQTAWSGKAGSEDFRGSAKLFRDPGGNSNILPFSASSNPAGHCKHYDNHQNLETQVQHMLEGSLAALFPCKCNKENHADIMMLKSAKMLPVR